MEVIHFATLTNSNIFINYSCRFFYVQLEAKTKAIHIVVLQSGTAHYLMSYHKNMQLDSYVQCSSINILGEICPDLDFSENNCCWQWTIMKTNHEIWRLLNINKQIYRWFYWLIMNFNKRSVITQVKWGLSLNSTNYANSAFYMDLHKSFAIRK